ncbi:hypothetical protein BVX95_02135 [archaeon D22]|nr:hypothetical protein BVX95_02135 [archaeon D22]
MKQLPELLAPVGNMVMLRAAIDAGADAVYFGVKGFNMRANAKNFELGQIKKIVKLCHENNVKAYMTINIIIYDNELDKLRQTVTAAKEAGVDAIICWDLAVINECKKQDIEFHISTQASISNFESLKFYHALGAPRVVLARECTLEQIKDIKKKIKDNKLDVEIEAFIHGAMCISVSGRCFLSQFEYCKSANRGECLQPCRRSYQIIDKETGREFELGTDYVLSPKDMCTIEIVDKLIEAGIDSFKIEGRMRSEEYVKTVVSAYREAIDNYPNINTKKLLDELKTVYNRGFSDGFYMGKPINEFTDAYGSKATTNKVYIGKIKKFYNAPQVLEMTLEQDIKIGDNLMVQGPTTGVKEETISSIQIDGEPVKSANKKDRIGIKLGFKARPNDKVFIIKKV